MDHGFNITLNNVSLTPLSWNDCERLRVLRNANREFFLSSKEITQNQQQEWYQRYKTKQDDVMFAVHLAAQPDCFIGASALYDIDKNDSSAEFGRLVIDKRYAGQGCGLNTTLATCSLGFGEIGLSSIYLDVLIDNKSALHLYEKAGFTVVCEEDANGKHAYRMMLSKEALKERMLDVDSSF